MCIKHLWDEFQPETFLFSFFQKSQKKLKENAQNRTEKNANARKRQSVWRAHIFVCRIIGVLSRFFFGGKGTFDPNVNSGPRRFIKSISSALILSASLRLRLKAHFPSAGCPFSPFATSLLQCKGEGCFLWEKHYVQLSMTMETYFTLYWWMRSPVLGCVPQWRIPVDMIDSIFLSKESDLYISGKLFLI